ncbi:serine/threonine-protein kinase [Enhygromyxa salina]|uniref:Serine/threonine-protein kinase PrkC n=1 Tax=Enhygromyxa salina TaxID=215803 RepID=A0A2S9YX86_9BACT|nr:serine/threonine-protein kinase [Enhygromyxa salina]PRQ09708.1 Serine/threonine-protein kinase PrkC [Enhygromyxa salina]
MDSETQQYATTDPTEEPPDLEPGLEPGPAWTGEPKPDHDGVLRVGRYPIIRKIGEGGMGVVYACYDEALDRRVAIKLLNSRVRSSSAQTRFEREAQGLARLSHPNVVQIYEIGAHQDALYLAMEYIDGQTLGAWLTEAERSWQAIIEILLGAGRGLAAAHAAGLIHRDFKPDNLMVGADGRVRVLDFGLVRGVSEAGSLDQTDDDALLDPESRGLLDQPVTRAGTILGTPAYMAPEQLQGRPSDAKTDQFALCAVAYEALFGIRPFPGNTTEAITAAMLSGQIAPGEDHRGVPRRVRAAIVHGLARDPDHRWASVDALLDQLRRALAGPRRRRAAVGVAAVLGAAIAGPWLLAEPAVPGPRCSLDDTALAGVWDEPRRASVRAAWSRGASDPAPTTAFVEASLDAWAEDWVRSQQHACQATWVEGRQSEAMLDKRTSCLDRQLRAFGAVTELFADADPELIARSPELLARLPDLHACASADLVELRYPPPENPERAAAIGRGFETLARARALADAGRLIDADASVDALAELGSDYPPLAIEIQALAGERLLWNGDRDRGLPAVLDAARAAEALHLDDQAASLRARVAIDAAGTWGRPELEQWLVADARAAVDRVGRANDPRRVDLHVAHGWLLDAHGEYEAALGEFQAAVATATTNGQTVRAELLRVNVARMLANLGRHDQAALEFEATRAAAAQHLGPGSLRLAEIELDLGLFAGQRGDFEDAHVHLDRARAIAVAAFGTDATRVTRIDLARGKLALTTGDLDRARGLYEDVLAAGVGPPEWRADAHEAIGVLEFYAGNYPASLAAYGEALALRSPILAADHPTLAILHSNIGESKAALGDHAGALAAYTQAIEAIERRLSADHFDLAFPLKGRGQSRLALGDAASAQADLERALSLHHATPGEPLEQADVEFSAARALAQQGDHAAARALAQQAHAHYGAFGQADRAAAINHWLIELHPAATGSHVQSSP